MDPPGLSDVPVDDLRRDVVAAAHEEAQELVVDGRLLVEGRQEGVDRGVVVEDLEHLGVLVAEDELDGSVLP